MLDRASRALGVSRSEVLRRGLLFVGDAAAREAAEAGAGGPRWAVTPATAGPGAPPPSIPVAPLREILRELSDDRTDR